MLMKMQEFMQTHSITMANGSSIYFNLLDDPEHLMRGEIEPEYYEWPEDEQE